MSPAGAWTTSTLVKLPHSCNSNPVHGACSCAPLLGLHPTIFRKRIDSGEGRGTDGERERGGEGERESAER